jgi:hypothetical protein
MTLLYVIFVVHEFLWYVYLLKGLSAPSVSKAAGSLPPRSQKLADVPPTRDECPLRFTHGREPVRIY